MEQLGVENPGSARRRRDLLALKISSDVNAARRVAAAETLIVAGFQQEKCRETEVGEIWRPTIHRDHHHPSPIAAVGGAVLVVSG